MDATFVLVEKEDVKSLHFPVEPIALSEADYKLLLKQLEVANTLGNLEHHKVKIFFKDSVGLKKVHTTVWAFTDKAILLKQNVVLPIHRIIKLEI